MDRIRRRFWLDDSQLVSPMNWQRIHRATGGFILLFVIAHFVNHGFLLIGPEAHRKAQDVLRLVYRHPIIEPVLIASICLQVFSGLRMFWRKGWPKRTAKRLQVMSGILLALFLVQHIGAALATRVLKPEIDTNIYWAASVVSRAPFSLYFIPYYAIGLMGIVVHLAVFIFLYRRNVQLAWGIGAVGIALSLAFVALLSGAFFEIELPPAYEAYLNNYWF